MAKLGGLISVALVLCLAGTAHAGTISYLADDASTSVQAAAITQQTVLGSDQAQNGGIQVTVATASTNSTANWTTTSGCNASTPGLSTGGALITGCGQASGSIGGGTWTLSETGDTGTALVGPGSPDQTAQNPWTLTYNGSTPLTSITLNGFVASIVFDRDTPKCGTDPACTPSGGAVGTPNGGFGIDATYDNNSLDYLSGTATAFTLNAQYSEILTLAGPNQGCQGSAFASFSTVTGCTDEWGKMTLTFTGGGAFDGTALNPATLLFFQDTDSVATPEPFTLGLMTAGLLALATLGRLRKNRTT
jgi:hypothetical protein